jgi:hypothetical protein
MAEKNDTVLRNLTRFWNFWIKFRWWLIVILIFAGAIVFYNRAQIGVGNALVYIVFFILFLMVILIFKDKSSLSFSINPLPPHLGLDGVSNEIK